MHIFTTAVTLFTLAGSVLSAVTPPTVTPTGAPPVNRLSPLNVEKYDGETTGKFIVRLKQDADKAAFISKVEQAKGQVTHRDWSIFAGFVGEFPAPVLDFIRGSPEVESITEDGIATAAGIQKNAPWGLARTSDTLNDQDPNAQKYIHYHPDNTLGSGVDIYVLDTGVRITHDTFRGRARWGATFGKGFKDEDDSGHGTHVAGVAAGHEYGIAKKANIIAVKVLDKNNRGTTADIISGLNWVLGASSSGEHPSVVNLSFIHSAHKDLDDAVRKLIAAGIHVVVSAGNNNQDASKLSPTRVESVVTVASSTIKDEKYRYSNYGSVVKLFAPGDIITSAWNTNDVAVKKMSGTSFAAPHVSGLIAYFIGADGNSKPTEMIRKLQRYAQKNAVKNVPRGTPNYLIQNRLPDTDDV